jgi:hypothetical protein
MQFKKDKYVHFVLLPEVRSGVDEKGNVIQKIGSVSFRTYTDRTGALKRGVMIGVQYVEGKDERGRDKGKNFTLGQSHNAFRCHVEQRDVYGTLMVDFLKNAPMCEGSPNGDYDEDGKQLNVQYRLMDDEKDAEILLEATRLRSKAEYSASEEIDDQTLIEIAALIGFHGDPDAMMRFKVADYARRNPKDYFAVLERGDRFLRAVVRKAKNDKVLTEKGSLIYWGNQLLGATEDAAVAYLIQNEDVLDRLKELVNLKAPEPKPGKAKKK